MRKVIDFCENWRFIQKDGDYFLPDTNISVWHEIQLPHTWNNLDGQDGGGDYYRGRCWYRNTFTIDSLSSNQELWVQFDGANHIADVYCNGVHIGAHRGGFARFQFNLTAVIQTGKNVISVCVDNSAGTHVYPQHADFTFFGGIYRPARLIWLNEDHFEMNKYGTDGVFVTPRKDGFIRFDAFVTANKKVRVLVKDANGQVVASNEAFPENKHAIIETHIENVQYWEGNKNPYLYSAEVTLEESDAVTVRFGVRDYKVDQERGFILNGAEYPLRGVCRHQDRENMGWAITDKEHNEDITIIKEIGATAIRLAHYQHSQKFYDLCDEYGMIIWAEIPFISVFDPSEEAKENTLLQMRELIAQNYNHPSICFWGISNEISIGGETPELEQNLVELHDMAKQLDPSRLTTIANMSMTPLDSKHNFITDIVAYNHYFGWYGGTVQENGEWFDRFHQQNPNIPIGLSEYGAEGLLQWHTDDPRVKDYTEEYHAYYHEEMLKMFETRSYLWGTFLWNMFDFAADARDEGGCKGRNNKGLVTYDRKTKKDAFYLYKAYWTSKPFIHLSGKRYVDRPGETATFKVYSNCPVVTLYVNEKKVTTLESNKVFIFENIPLSKGENIVTVKTPELTDQSIFNRVQEPNLAYTLIEENGAVSESVTNWFKDLLPENQEFQYPEGYYSVRDTIADLMKNSETAAAMHDLLIHPLMIDAENSGKGESDKELLQNAAAIPLETIWPFINKKLPGTALLLLNERLTKVKK